VAGWLPIVLILATAVTVRLAHVATSEFPLGDGGLFLVMVEQLRANSYALPDAVAYNGNTIPFTYPPFGFYLAGIAADASGAAVTDVMRVVPFLFSCVTAVAFWILARTILTSRAAVLAATFAFATLPLAYRYFVMGAGITRSPGYLFAIATVWLVYLVAVRHQTRALVPAAMAGGLTILSHPNAAWFAVYSATLVVLLHSRRKRTLGRALVVAVGAVIVAAPWLALAISRHGFAPFLGATQSSNPGPSAIELLFQMRITEEPILPLLALLAVIGVLVSARDGRWWLPAWLIVACALDTRYSGTFAMVPLALLVGVAARALAEMLQRSASGESRSMAAWFLTYGTTAWLATLSLAGTLLSSEPLQALPASHRAAMHWVSTTTPPEASFLVVAPSGIAAGSESEWFPVLAGRRSLATYQGTEWLPRGGGPSPWERYAELQDCGGRDVQCLDDWAAAEDATYDYVYLREVATQSLRHSLTDSSEFVLAYQGQDVWIFGRRPDQK
jgi:hypothetical protein